MFEEPKRKAQKHLSLTMLFQRVGEPCLIFDFRPSLSWTFFFDLYRAVLLNFVLIVVSSTANTHKKWQYLLLASAWRHLNFRWNLFMLRAVSFWFLRKQSIKQSGEMAKPKGFVWVLKKHSFQLKGKNNRQKNPQGSNYVSHYFWSYV